mmetsp:Transcript_18675/g.51102  ORF Transcript_18675/g.51102 Transcript_18675/m.51102 type:complete len:231 (+) Transcript_18675:2365-3057(+)
MMIIVWLRLRPPRRPPPQPSPVAVVVAPLCGKHIVHGRPILMIVIVVVHNMLLLYLLLPQPVRRGLPKSLTSNANIGTHGNCRRGDFGGGGGSPSTSSFSLSLARSNVGGIVTTGASLETTAAGFQSNGGALAGGEGQGLWCVGLECSFCCCLVQLLWVFLVINVTFAASCCCWCCCCCCCIGSSVVADGRFGCIGSGSHVILRRLGVWRFIVRLGCCCDIVVVVVSLRE